MPIIELSEAERQAVALLAGQVYLPPSRGADAYSMLAYYRRRASIDRVVSSTDGHVDAEDFVAFFQRIQTPTTPEASQALELLRQRQAEILRARIASLDH